MELFASIALVRDSATLTWHIAHAAAATFDPIHALPELYFMPNAGNKCLMITTKTSLSPLKTPETLYVRVTVEEFPPIPAQASRG